MLIDAATWRSLNFSARPGPPSGLLLHSGEGSRESDLRTLCDSTVPMVQRVSAHYYVCRNALIYELVDPLQAAWHAGDSYYLGRFNWNDFSIGIETEHRTGQDWPSVQVAALKWLCELLMGRFGIRPSMIAAHRWVAIPAGRKQDPSDWPDAALRSWIGGLTPMITQPEPTVLEHFPAPRRYRTIAQSNLRSSPTLRQDAVKAVLPVGIGVPAIAIVQGANAGDSTRWLKLADGWGYLHDSLVELETAAQVDTQELQQLLTEASDGLAKTQNAMGAARAAAALLGQKK